MEQIIECNNLTHYYGKRLIYENLSFTVPKGRILGLLGKNGTGKTTLLNILSGKEGYDSGNIVFRRDLRVDYLEQDPQYPEELTVLEACFHHGNSTVELIKEYERCMETEGHPGLDDLLVRMDHEKAWEYEQKAKQILSQLKIRNFDQQVKHLSGGQLKRVALANALITEPDLLILDEPINGLDPQGIAEVRDTIQRLQKERNMTICISSHILEELSKIATDYGIIHNGSLLQELTREELMRRCSERMELTLADPKLAIPVLDAMGFTNYQVTDKEHIHIFERLNESAALNMELAKAGIPVKGLSITSEELETYFLNLTGGASHA